MYNRGQFYAIILAVIVLLGNSHLCAEDEEISGVKGINFGPSSTQSISAVSSDPSQSGINDESVNVYTGQHMEAYVLASLSGRGGVTASLVLAYNGNVTRMAKQENRVVQASPFGLGFTADQESITCDPKGTAGLGDDDYQLVAGGSSLKLHHVEDNRYITEKGHPWQIYRETAFVGGYEVIIGWTIKREDGTVYRYGDFSTDFSSFNATANTFRYGGRVGNGVLADDEPYPVGWHLHVIHDPDSLNWAVYNYVQERDSLMLRPTSSDTVYSAHHYTRAIYVDEICLSDGGKIDIDYEPRTDYQPFYGLNFFEYYSTYRADRVTTVNFAGDTLSIVEMNYDYLMHSDTPFYKLLLTEIVSHSGKDPGLSLPPTKFEYFADATDPAYGAIKKITYPAGGVKEMHYSVLDESENISQLDLVVDDAGSSRQFVSQNLVVNAEDNFGNSSIAFWDGFWHKTTLVGMTLSVDDIPGVAPDNWAVVFNRFTEDLVVLRFNNGCLELDGLNDMEQFTNSDYFVSSNRVYIYPGEDCFLAVAVQYRYEDGQPFHFIHSAFYYRWDGETWTDYEILQQSGREAFVYARVTDDIMAIKTLGADTLWIAWPVETDFEDSRLLFGKYNHDADAVVLDSVEYNNYRYCKFVIGSDYAAYMKAHSVVVATCDGVSWTRSEVPLSDWYEANGETRHLRNITKFHNSDGFVVTYDNDASGRYSYVTAVFPSADGWVARPKQLSTGGLFAENYRIDEISGGSHFVIAQKKELELSGIRFEWDGYSFQSTIFDAAALASYAAEVHRDSYCWGRKNLLVDYGENVRAWQYLGNQTWSDRLLSTPTVKRYMYSSSENFLIANVGTEDYSANNLYMYEPFYYGIGSNYRGYTIHSANNDNSAGHFFAAGDGFCIKHDFDDVDQVVAYKVVDTLFKGKPQIVTVDSVTLSTYADDPDPRIIQYSFYQGMLDQTAITPRFCKAEKSTPYFASESSPEGWQVSYFYNDMDGAGDNGYIIEDGHISDVVETPPLTPWDEIMYPYGRTNGGHWLDGMPFLEYSYSTDSGLTEIIDSRKIFYRLMETPDVDYVNDVYRVVVHRDTSMTEGIQSIAYYKYNEYNGMLREKFTRVSMPYGQAISKCDSVKYAFEDTEDPAMAADMLADNAIAQTLEHFQYASGGGGAVTPWWDTTVYTGQRYTRTGSWQASEKFTWRDFSNPDDTLYQVSDIDFDEYGNVISSVGQDNVRSSVKFDAGGSLVVAEGSNCTPEALVVQDFEQGISWDGWTDFNLGAYRSLETDAFTGEYSYKIADDPSETAHMWGPLKEQPTQYLGWREVYFSAWAMGNHTLRVHCTIFFGDGTECHSQVLEFSDLDDSEWQKIEGVFDLNDVSISCVSGFMHIEWCLVDETSDPAPAGAFVMVDNVRLHPADAHVTTTVYDLASGQVSAELGLNNISRKFEYDEFNRLVATKDYRSQTIAAKAYHFSEPGSGDPNYTKSIAYFTGEDGLDSAVSISFYDGLSNLLQTRRSGYVVDDTDVKLPAALVSGISDHDGRGRVIRQYKSYYDLIAPNGVEDFSDESNYPAEVNLYYNGVNAADCGGVPYTETRFYAGIRSLVREQSGPGVDWQMSGGHTTTYEYETDAENFLMKTATVDPDGIRMVRTSDLWNHDEYDSLYYTDASGVPTVATNITYNSVTGETDSVAICDGGEDPAVLRRYWYNDLGLTDSTWRMDYGTIRMKYDQAGRLRFMQNDQRAVDSSTVYYQYDKHGNVIAEGLCYWPYPWDIEVLQIMADDPSAPYDSWPDVEKKYCWAYDYQPATDQYHFGQVAFTANGDSSYYKSYFYKPFEETDSTVIKLKIDGGELKSIVHKYDPISGRVIEMEVYPYLSIGGGRAVAYMYDDNGLTGLKESCPGDIGISRVREFAQTIYNAEGQPERRSIGIYDDPRFIPEIHDTVQVLNYYYNSLGLLTGINHPDSVVDEPDGIGGANPHFGMLLDYTDGGDGYFNGRVARMRAANSTANNGVVYPQDYRYSYNELGWLTEAEEQAVPEYYRGYFYNYLGNRDSVMTGSAVTRYDYDPVVGSSKLIGFDGVAERNHDILGNLVSDDSRDVYELSYDYRNLMSRALVKGIVDNGDPQRVYFEYDEAGQRIYKRFRWAYKEICGDPWPPKPVRDFESSTTGKYKEGRIDATILDARPIVEYCVFWDATEDHYLYDGGALLMTFDENDAVRQFYINGKDGRVAVYPDNDSDRRYYILSDQIGSARVLVDDEGEVQQWNAYHPFGGIRQTWAAYNDRMKFSGKERDVHSTFDYYYFGARYLDTRIGMFTSVDKAGQFAGGYLYGGNNPILGVDPDGNLAWFVPVILGAWFGGCSGLVYAVDHGLDDPWKYALGGAAIGAISGYIGHVAGGTSKILGMAAGSFSHSVGFSVLTGSGSGVGVNFGLGSINLNTGKTDWVFSGEGNLLSDVFGVLAVGEDFHRFVHTRFFRSGGEVGSLTVEGNIAKVEVTVNGETRVEEYDLEKLSEYPKGTHVTKTGDNTYEAVANPLDHKKGHVINYQSPQGESWTLHIDIRNDYLEVHIDSWAGAEFPRFRNIGTTGQHIIFDWAPWFVANKMGPVGRFLASPVKAGCFGLENYYNSMLWAY